MRFIHSEYNMLHNCIDVTTFDGYVLRIDCGKAEEGLKTTPCSECALNALAVDNPLEYAIHRRTDGFSVSCGQYADMGRCGRFIRIVVTYLSLHRELVKM